MSNILIVDDDIDMQKLVGSILRRAGYFVLTANDGREALENEYSATPNLLILDKNMRDMGGLELVEILKSEPATENIRVIMLSSDDTVEQIVEGLDAGADDYIVKPFNKKDLLARVRSQLRTKTIIDHLVLENLRFKGINQGPAQESSETQDEPDTLSETTLTDPEKPAAPAKAKAEPQQKKAIQVPKGFIKIAKGGIKEIVFICKANLFRSPIAEQFFKRKAREMNLRIPIRARSAGVRRDLIQSKLNKSVMETLFRMGVDLETHLSRPITNEIAHKSDLLLVMEEDHKEQLTEAFPFAADKIFLLGSFREDEERGRDIADPIGENTTQVDYRVCCYNINQAITGLLKCLRIIAKKNAES